MKFTTPQRESSRWALGNDGADKNNPDSQLRTTDEQQRQDQESSSDSRETSDRPSSDKSESKSSESTKSDQSASEKSRSGERTDDGRSEDQKTTEQRDGREPGRRESDTSSKQRDQDQSDKNKPDKDQSSKDRSDKSQSDKEQRDSSESRSREDKTSKDGSRSDTGHSRDQDKKPSGEKQTQNQLKPPNRPTQAPSKPWLQLPHVSTSLGGIFKLVVYAILFCIVGYLLWKSRARVMAAIRQFLQEFTRVLGAFIRRAGAVERGGRARGFEGTVAAAFFRLSRSVCIGPSRPESARADRSLYVRGLGGMGTRERLPPRAGPDASRVCPAGERPL